MELSLALAIAVFIFAVALLYSSVGHGGGSGYLAIMALFSMTPQSMRPSALILNIAVAAIAARAFVVREAFSWRVFWPVAVTAVPMAFIGGRIDVPAVIYQPLLAAVLLYSAYYLYSPRTVPVDDPNLRPPMGAALVSGAAIGLLSGLTGIGGGVFLSPLLLFKRWAATRVVAGVSALFILANSTAGLLGQLSSTADVPWKALAIWVPLALIGGFLGSRYGASKAPSKTIYRLLAAVLLIAVAKLIITLLG